MGLIRSGHCSLTPESDDKTLTSYLWKIVKEIIKTNIENSQNLIVEGCYIPFNYKKDFTQEFLDKITFICLIFSLDYINRHFDSIKSYENIIESRKELINDCNKLEVIKENRKNLELCEKYNLNYYLIKNKYYVNYSF